MYNKVRKNTLNSINFFLLIVFTSEYGLHFELCNLNSMKIIFTYFLIRQLMDILVKDFFFSKTIAFYAPHVVYLFFQWFVKNRNSILFIYAYLQKYFCAIISSNMALWGLINNYAKILTFIFSNKYMVENLLVKLFHCTTKWAM